MKISICCICLGSRGDVLPVANIIRAFCNNKRIRRTTTAEKGGSSSHNDNETEITVSRDEDLLLYGGGRVAFITHKAHAKILQKVFRDCKEQVILDLVDFPILYHSSNSSEDKFSSCAVKNDPKIGDNRIKYEQRDHHHSCSRSNALAEMKILYEKTKGYMAQDTSSSSSSFQTTLDVIVYNLYTLAGYHICEALSVPGLVLACGIIPPSSRKNDQRRLKDIFRNQPYLKWAMETKHHLREKQLIRLNASDLEHWMLPLWSSHYQAFRLELGLGAFPLSSLRHHHHHHHHHHHVLGRCTEKIRKGHKTIATAAAAYIRKEEDLHHGVIKQVRRRTRVIKHQQEQKKKQYENRVSGPLPFLPPLPPPPPTTKVLYGISEAMFTLPGYISPSRIRCCGYWLVPEDEEERESSVNCEKERDNNEGSNDDRDNKEDICNKKNQNTEQDQLQNKLSASISIGRRNGKKIVYMCFGSMALLAKNTTRKILNVLTMACKSLADEEKLLLLLHFPDDLSFDDENDTEVDSIDEHDGIKDDDDGDDSKRRKIKRRKTTPKANNVGHSDYCWRTSQQFGKNEALIFHGYISHSWLFQRVDVIVHHGGAQTVGQAVKACKPQLILPIWCDQTFWGERVSYMEIGRAIYLKKTFDVHASKDICNQKYENDLDKGNKLKIIIQTIASSLRIMLTEAFQRKCTRNCNEIISAANFNGIESAVVELVAMIKKNRRSSK